MRKKSRFPWVRSLVLTCALALTSPFAMVTNAEDTINVPGPLSPRELAIPFALDPADVRLTDSAGRTIPLTGKGVQASADGLSVFPPKLAEGVYVLTYPGGSETFSVGNGSTMEPSPRSSAVVWVVAGSLLVLGGVLLVTRRRALAMGVTLLAVMVPLVPTTFSPALDVQAPDPCAGVDMWEDRLRCMFEHVQSVLDDAGVAQAVDRLEALAARPEGRWGVACHEIAHYLGQLSWKETSDVERLVEAGTLSCSFGYFHGLLESIGTYSTDAVFPDIALAVCSTLEERFAEAVQDGSVRECAHGIGHAAMWRHNENLSVARLVCEDLPEESWRQECDSGAVMSWVFARESSRVANRPQDAPEPTVVKPLDLCSPPLGAPTPGCVDGALSGTLRAEYEDSVAWCRANPGQERTCASSLGRRLMAWEVEGGFDAPGESRKLCATLHETTTGRQDCMAEVSWVHLYVLRDYDRTQRFCAAVGEEFTRGCREGVLRFYETMIRRGDSSGGEVPPDVREELERAR